ncbi:MAG: M48 family metallopeptidase [Muribaculaceae bacterium]|nr:M48 family metallopeptidase [Muribaculaceae bacterium]
MGKFNLGKIKNIVATLFLICNLTTVAVASEWRWDKLLSSGINAYQAATLTDKKVQEYVHEYIVYLDKKSNVAPANNKYAIRLKNLTKGLNDVEGVPLNFKVYITNDVNAFACADGSVRVYSGLMDLMTDDEVLGVIGHEIGHVAHKDTKRAMKQALINAAVIDGIGSTGDFAANLSDSQLSEIGQVLLSQKYSRKQESEADDYGYDFLVENGKNPWAMAMAFSKLYKLEKGGSSKKLLAKMFSSHPTTEARIKHIKDKCEEDGIEKPAGCNL